MLNISSLKEIPSVRIAIKNVDPSMDALLIRGLQNETALIPILQQGHASSNVRLLLIV